MIDDLEDQALLERARRIGLRRTPLYTYMTWLSVVAFAWAATFYLLELLSPEVDSGAGQSLFVVMAGIAICALLLDPLWAWFLVRRWGLPSLLKMRTVAAEDAADRDDHHAVLAALDPVRRFWGSEEMLLTARARIALRKTGEI